MNYEKNVTKRHRRRPLSDFFCIIVFSFLTQVPSKTSYDNKVAVEQRIKEDVDSDEFLSWALVKQRPVLLRDITKCVTMSHYEYKFWLDMTDIKTGYIKKQGKGNFCGPTRTDNALGLI